MNKINKIIEKRDIIDKFIEDVENQWKTTLRMRDNDKEETKKILNFQCKRTGHLIEKVDALIAKPLTYQKTTSSQESPNTSK